MVVRVGFHNESTLTTAPTVGLWWELNSANAVPTDWYYCAAGLATPCVDSGVAASQGQMSSLEIYQTAAGAATFRVSINGGAVTTKTAAGAFASGAGVYPAITQFATAGSAGYWLSIGYVQLSGVTSGRR
jgi:hypothetical protein